MAFHFMQPIIVPLDIHLYSESDDRERGSATRIGPERSIPDCDAIFVGRTCFPRIRERKTPMARFVKSSFVLDFAIRTIGRNAYFIPVYAMHRPACKNLMKGKLHEPRTQASRSGDEASPRQHGSRRNVFR